jgi:HlyD family secretion protein
VLAEFDLVPLQATVEEARARVARLRAQLTLIEDSSVELADLAAAEARVNSSLDRVRAAEAQIETARARVARTQRDLERARELVEAGALDAQSLDGQELAATEASEALKQAEAELAAQRGVVTSDRSNAQMIESRIGLKALERRQVLASLEEAEAQLESARHDLNLAQVVSPIDGVVLERYERGEAPVVPGTPLLLLGNPAEIEVIADVLTEDALRLGIGGEVALESLAGERMLGGRVRRIEPQGFTKLSSLGVEQQRVNVIVELNEPRPELGVGFRLHARFFTGSREDALIVPRYSVLQAPDQSFYVFVVEGNQLRRRGVTLGLRSDLEVEVLSGLDEDARVVAAPDSTMEEGASVTPVRPG